MRLHPNLFKLVWPIVIAAVFVAATMWFLATVAEAKESRFVWPIDKPQGITTYFAWWHQGIDIAAPYGDEIVAAEGGIVRRAGWDWTGFGNSIEIWNEEGENLWLYAHMDTIEVDAGERIRTGQRIGTVGCNGWCTGPHLHFAVWWENQPIDPLVSLP